MDIGFCIEEGILEKYEGSDPVVSIPEGVTKIADHAFAASKTLTELIMPDSVTKIGKYAFQKCAKLKTVVFSQQLTSIGYEAFAGCKALKEIHLPNTLKTVESGAFAGCVKLGKATCDSAVFELGGNPFSAYGEPGCNLLFDKEGFLVFANVLYQYNANADVITVPDGVTHIADGVFQSGTYSWSKKLDVTKVILPNSVTYVGRYAFANCTKLEQIRMPDGIKFGAHVFDGCSKLADHNGLVILGNKALAYLGDQTVVEIPEGVESLADHLFSAAEMNANPNNSQITKVVLPEGLKQIGAFAFKGCASLQEINIPDSVEIIHDGAFYDCTRLSAIAIPPTTTVCRQSFRNCSGLADENGFIIINHFLFQYIGSANQIDVPEHVLHIGSGAFSRLRVKKIRLPSGLKTLGAAFCECVWLEEIDIPESITTIAPETFWGCQALKRVNLPAALTYLGRKAFANCVSLETIEIPEGVTQIEDEVFEGCTALKAIRFPDGIQNIPSYVCSKCTALEIAVIPENTAVIECAAFEGCTSLKALVLPPSVKKIDQVAFSNCTALKNLVISNPDCNIDLSAFHNCPKLTDKAGMKIIAGVLLAYTGKGGEVVIPDTVTEIAPNVFREGHEYRRRNHITYRKEGSLQKIVIPASVKTICAGAFQNCVNLTQITMEDGVEAVCKSAFEGCEALCEITLPQTLQSLAARAFAGCKKLTSITIPRKLSAISLDVFRDCSLLENIFVEEGNPRYCDVDGILYNAEKTALLYCPAGKQRKAFTVADSVSAIADHAFIDCQELEKIVIPATVKEIGSEVFPRIHWSRQPKLTDIQIAPGAGSHSVGEAAIAFPYGDDPLVYPTVPVLFPKEQTIQVRLGLGFCQFPEKYTAEYAEGYRKYAQSHQKTLLKKATQLKLKAVEEYFTANSPDNAKNAARYKPNLSIKKPNELQKVEILEEAVLKGTLEDLKAVLLTYKTFEITARALGLAARYRGMDFVRVLIEHGATFLYQSDAALLRKYSMEQKTASGSYSTEYYLMIVPEKLNLTAENYGYRYDYTPMYGISYMNITPELEAKTLSLNARVEVAKFFAENKTPGVSMDEMLFWALTGSELDFADSLIAMGVNLRQTPPSYYPTCGMAPTYLQLIISGSQSIYWGAYTWQMSRLAPSQLLPVLERFHTLAESAGQKLILTQKLFDTLNWCDASLAFALDHMDLTKVNQKQALERAVTQNFIASLAKMAEAGWIAQPAKREKLIAFAYENQKTEALAWLMDYKNRTVDLAAEEAKAEAKMLRELTENPNSVSALKKIWSYKKLDDGTLQITNYKGSDTEVTVPSQIGKSTVSSIGEYAFSCRSYKKAANDEVREKITSLVLPEGITEIGDAAFFGCKSLTAVSLPSTLKAIGAVAFKNCTSLKSIKIPAGTKQIGHGVFWGCDQLYTGSFLIVNHILFGCTSNDEAIEIPEGVTVIADRAFTGSGTRLKNIRIPNTVEVIGKDAFAQAGLETLEIPESVKRIEDRAFSGCKQLKEIHLNPGLQYIGSRAFEKTSIHSIIIPQTVTEMGREVFQSCSQLRDISVPDSVARIGADCFGWVISGKYIHTVEGSYTDVFLKKYYPGAVVLCDYGSEDCR